MNKKLSLDELLGDEMIATGITLPRSDTKVIYASIKKKRKKPVKKFVVKSVKKK